MLAQKGRRDLRLSRSRLRFRRGSSEEAHLFRAGPGKGPRTVVKSTCNFAPFRAGHTGTPATRVEFGPGRRREGQVVLTGSASSASSSHRNAPLLPPPVAAPAAVPDMPVLPQAVGKYRVLERLGSGAMGVVYKCTQPDLDR